MCNACGFFCCAYDRFSGCGCEHCDNPACWPGDDVVDDEADGEEFYCAAIEPKPGDQVVTGTAYHAVDAEAVGAVCGIVEAATGAFGSRVATVRVEFCFNDGNNDRDEYCYFRLADFVPAGPGRWTLPRNAPLSGDLPRAP